MDAQYDSPIKRCSRCKQEKELNMFPVEKRYRGGVSCWCKRCMSNYIIERRDRNLEASRLKERQRYIKDKAKFIAQGRKGHFRRKYNMTLQEVDRILEDQNGVCAICGGVSKRMNIDHDHLHKTIRGILCIRCNIALGLVHENTNTLRTMALYLERWNDSQISFPCVSETQFTNNTKAP